MNDSLGDDYSRVIRVGFAAPVSRISVYLSLHPRINARPLFSLALPRRVARRAFAVTRGTCQRDARTKRFGTGSTKSAVARAKRTMRTCEEGQDERVREEKEEEKEKERR